MLFIAVGWDCVFVFGEEGLARDRSIAMQIFRFQGLVRKFVWAHQ